MNNQRRKVLSECLQQLDAVDKAIQSLAADEATLGEGDRAKSDFVEKHRQHVKGWQGILSEVQETLETVREEEEESSENVSGENRQETMRQNAESLAAAVSEAETLANLERPRDFTEKWVESYQTIISAIEGSQE